MAGDRLYPPCTPCLARQLSVGDGHILHVEECGPADGLPVVFLHDGPGFGCRPEHRRLFDPQRFRAILVDQRGAGQSRPAGQRQANTTPDLVADLDYVRRALGLAEWIIIGHGWGSLLGLAYAQLFPERTTGLVLCGVFLGSRHEIDGLVHARLAGQGGEISAAARAASFSGQSILDWLEDEFDAPEPGRARRARLAWSSGAGASGDAAQALADARLQVHFLRRHCFLAEGSLLAGMTHVRHLPGVIVQGLDDPIYPPRAAEALHRVWPEATWMPLAGAGHDLNKPAVARKVIKALDWVAECVAIA